jgi:EAL and modified HD-GYP domain-containing signal transduction protein
MLDNTVVFGLEELARGLPAFVNCTVESLTEELVQVLPPSMTVLELSSGAEPTPSLLAACRKLKALGFRLALTDFSANTESRPLADLADYIKVDIHKVDALERANLLRWLAGSTASLVAQNVETQQQYGQVCKEGFDLFQGYYFCRPEPLESHKIPGNRLVHLEILEDLQNDPVDLQRLSQLVMCDASLTYRLLRLVNSPICAMRQEVTSIQTALMLVGEASFRRVAMLAIASDFSTDQPAEILRIGGQPLRNGPQRAISDWHGQPLSGDAAHPDGGPGAVAAHARGGSRCIAGQRCPRGRSAALDCLQRARELGGVRFDRPLQRPES